MYKPYDVEIEYLESTGAYITLPIVVNNSTYVCIEYSVTKTYAEGGGSDSRMFGVWESNSTCAFAFLNGSNQIRHRWGQDVQANLSQTKGERLRFTVSDNTAKNENLTRGTSVSTTIGNSFPNQNFKLFHITHGARIYSAKIGNFDLIPVRVGDIGYMYDKASGQLFGNAGTGSFTLGPDMYDSRIEYLQSTGTQWIDTEVDYDSTVSVMANMRINNSATRTLFGIYYNNGTINRWSATTTNSNNRLYAYFGTITNKYITISLNTWYTLILNNRYLNVNSSLLDSTATAFATDDNPVSIYIFGRHGVQPQSEPADTIDTLGASLLRYMKIWKGTTLIRDFIPVRKGDVGYLYDNVSNRLFGNSGTGVFTLGRDVDPIPTTFDAPVQYIKFTGHQFIDTGIYGNLSTKVSLRCYPTGYNLTQNILCTSNDTSNSICFGRGSGARWSIKFNDKSIWHTTLPSPYGNNWFDVIVSNTIRQIKAPNKTGCVKDETETLVEFTTPDTLILGAHASGYDPGWNNYRGYIGAFQIRQGGLLVRDYIPVRKDGVGYLYDRVTESMFGNDGVETIGYGPDNLQPIPIIHGEGTTRYYTRRDIIQMNQEQVYNCVVSWQSNDNQTSTTAQLYHGQRYKYEYAWGDISGTNFTFWATNYTGRHKTLNVKAGQKYKIKADIVQATVLVFCNDHVYASRKKLTGIQSITINPGTEAVITVPSGYSYMMICAATSQGNTLTLPDRITRLVAYG